MTEVALSASETAALTHAARERGVTVNTVVQVAWALVLGVLTGRSDVVFGATVSGRAPSVSGIETMIGLFINTVPVRVRLDPRETIGDLLARVQGEQSALLDHHHIGLADIQQSAGPGAVFDTLTVFESYPVDRSALEHGTDIAGLRVVGVEGLDATHYPLTVMVGLTERLQVSLKHRVGSVTSAEAESIGARLRFALTAIAHDVARPVADIDLLSGRERETRVPARGGPRGRRGCCRIS